MLFNGCFKFAGFDKKEACARNTAMTISLHFDVRSSETTPTARNFSISEQPVFDEFSHIFLKQ